MRTITVRLNSDKDVELLKNILNNTNFEATVETFDDTDTLSDDELAVLNERLVAYQQDPARGKTMDEINLLLKQQYGV